MKWYSLRVISGKEKQFCRLLTGEEEEILVQFIKKKNRALQTVNRKELNKVIIQMLKLRDTTNKKMRVEGNISLCRLLPKLQVCLDEVW